MPCINNYENFPCIQQQNNDWCIPASIENVMRFFNFVITQEQIIQHFLQKNNSRGMCFATMADILEEQYGDHFEFQVVNHRNANTLVQYVDKRITSDNLPVIVSIEITNNRAHMLIVLCIDSDTVQVFDTGGRNRLMRITRQLLIQRLAPSSDTLVINPLKK